MEEFRVIKTILALLYLEVGLHIIEIVFDLWQHFGVFKWAF